MSSLKQLFLIPVGLPGLGKTTLCHQLSQCLQSHKMNTKDQIKQQIQFHRVSYDAMLLKHQQDYQQKYPTVPFHQAIDIIRSKADQEYLETIQQLWNKPSSLEKQVYFLDRNNTADIWKDLLNVLPHHPHATTLVLAPIQPQQSKSDDTTSHTQHFAFPQQQLHNPITPSLFYTCAKRIFSRTTHDCLSSADKPQAIDVLLKFTRLYDGVPCFNSVPFDRSLHLDYGITNQQIDRDVSRCIEEAIRETPRERYASPRKDVVQKVIEVVERQIKREEEEGVLQQESNQQRENQQSQKVNDMLLRRRQCEGMRQLEDMLISS